MGKIEQGDGSGPCWHILANLDERPSGHLLRRRQYSRVVVWVGGFDWNQVNDVGPLRGRCRPR